MSEKIKCTELAAGHIQVEIPDKTKYWFIQNTGEKNLEVSFLDDENKPIGQAHILDGRGSWYVRLVRWLRKRL